MADQQNSSTMAPTEVLADAIWGRGNYRVVEAWGEEWVLVRPGCDVGESGPDDDRAA
jgi:hypothetical protein